MNIGSFLASTLCLLLAVMAYDRYVAICLPLYYTIIMNWKMCRNITCVMWCGSILISAVPPIIRPMVFCVENKLDHFTCEILAVLELACENITFYRVALFFMGLTALVLPLVFIVVSYILIISSILKIRSADGRNKAFTTCASHLTVVSVFYGTIIILYMGKTKSFSSYTKYISVVYGVVNPVLNPLIYSLRNKEVKESFKKMMIKYSLQGTA
ncbi:olfactory receptor 2K2-like [Mantella aurantiaca]